MSTENKYQWQYCSLGGVTRVNVTSGEDIAHLGELDQKMWTVLSCPVKGLKFDPVTLKLIDTDADGMIRVKEIVAAAEWVTSALKNKDLLLSGPDTVKFADIDEASETGAAILDSAKHILTNLGLEKDEISLADTSDSVAIFAKTQFNGDGVITPASADDEALKDLITKALTVASQTDRSGEAGVTAEIIEQFYAECADYSAWRAAADADAAIFPYGDNTAAALDACNALKDKVADYFMRCKLIAFNDQASQAVDVSVDSIAAISALNLAEQSGKIAEYPLARPSADAKLPFGAINPAWQAAFATLKSLVLDADFAGKDSITEQEWNATLAKFAPYTAWVDAKKGTAVEPLGLEAVNAVLEQNRKADLLALVEQDKALEAYAAGIDAVDKFTHLCRHFYSLLRNFVIFTDFYSREGEPKAVFEAGRLYIDQRCCNLCVKVEDMGKHADMAALSGMFLLYCKCTSKVKAETIDIAAVMTAGSIRNLRPGKNGVFYDRDGQDWDATIVKVVDNPISVPQAFWSPYRKLANFISEKINKSAADKDANAISTLQSKADEGTAAAKQPFDIGKFAGIFAALGLAVSAIGVALAALFKGILALKWWQLLLIIAAIMLLISGPACFIAWNKLRKRNLGPVLNANGWAVNSVVLVNILFGSTLTTVAKYPKLKLKDPYAKRTPAWKKWLRGIIAALLVAFGVLYFTGNLACIGLPREKKADVPAEEVTAPADTIAVEAAPEAVVE